MGGAALAEAPVQVVFKTHTHIMAGLEDISAADISESNWNEACATFDEMNLKEDLLRGIYAYGFEKPSTIQQRGIVPIVRGTTQSRRRSPGLGRLRLSPLVSSSVWTSMSSSARHSSSRPLVSSPTSHTRLCAPSVTTSTLWRTRALEAPRWRMTSTCCAVACTLSLEPQGVSST